MYKYKRNNYSSVLTRGLHISRCYHLMELDNRLPIISNTIEYSRTDNYNLKQQKSFRTDKNYCHNIGAQDKQVSNFKSMQPFK